MSRRLGNKIQRVWVGCPWVLTEVFFFWGGGVKCLTLDMLVWAAGWHRGAMQSSPPSGEDQGGRAESWGEEMPSGMSAGRGGQSRAWLAGVPPSAEQVDVGASTRAAGEQGEEWILG